MVPLVLNRYFALYDGRLLMASLFDSGKHGMCLLVGAVVAHTTDPSR